MILYRCSSYTTAERIHLVIEEHEVKKETKCGYWIGSEYVKRWVSKTSTKRFAYPSKEEAVESFTARKRRQIKILNSQIMNAEDALELVQKVDLGDPKTFQTRSSVSACNWVEE